MAAEERDDQAKALEKLSRGESVDPETPLSSGTVNLGETAPVIHVERPAAPLPSAAVTPKRANVRPPAPGGVKPVLRASAVPPPQLTASQSKVRPAAPINPISPKDRPAAPPPAENVDTNTATAPDQNLELSSALANVVEGSDVMFAPAPDISVLARAKIKPRNTRTPYVRTLHFRQTVIPVLLVLGISLPAMAVYWLLLDRDSLLRSAGTGLPIVLAIVGLVMLMLAVINMMAVKHELKRITADALTAKSVAP